MAEDNKTEPEVTQSGSTTPKPALESAKGSASDSLPTPKIPKDDLSDGQINKRQQEYLEKMTNVYHEDISRVTGIQNSILSLVALVLMALVVLIGVSVHTFSTHVESSAPVMLKILETQSNVSDKTAGAALKTAKPASAPERAADPTAIGLIISEMKWLTQMSAGIVLSLIISASAIVFALLQLAGKLTPSRFTDNHPENNQKTSKNSGQSEEKNQITLSLPSIEYIKGCGKVFSEFIESDSGKSLWGWIKGLFHSDKDKTK